MFKFLQNNKLLLVLHQYLPYWYTGTEQIVNKFSNYCKKKLINVEILAFEPKNNFLKKTRFKKKNYNGINTYYIKGEIDNFGINKDDASYKKILDQINPKKVIFFHVMRNIPLVNECIKRKLPYSLVLTDYFLACPHYSLVRKNGEECTSSLSGSLCSEKCSYDQNLISQRQEIMKNIMQNSNKIFISSNYFKEKFTKHFDDKFNKYEIFDYGSSIKENIKIRKIGPKIKIGYFGSFNENKGIKEILSFVEKSEGIEFIFCGSGPLKKLIKNYIKKYPQKITLKKSVDINELSEEIDNIDLGILLSKWPENMPLIIGEFLNRGKPVIVSNKGSLKIQISHKKNGFVMSDFKKEEFDRATDFCIKNYDSLSKEALLSEKIHEDIFLNKLLLSLQNN